ncbi:lysosome-associated membrane glycoprotein 1-like [Battus philenor]|uniref:lysosome-associated membrane glycoprotein 1-like n=1 Tax=Battus philenor TaxID=42288 RepID=UPI0035CFC5D6
MGYHRFLVFIALLCSFIVKGQGDITTKEPIVINLATTSENNPSSVVYPKSSSEAASLDVLGPSSEAIVPSGKPEATPAPTPAPTSAPTTAKTTPAPTTTTEAPTTTVTPTPEPKPTPAPGPLPAPTQGTWYYKDAENNTCILVQFAAQLNITYNINNSSSLAYVVLNVPANATVTDGSCNATEQRLKLSWPETGENTMLLTFTANHTTKYYALKSLNISLTLDIVNSSLTTPLELWHGVEWQVPLATSYRCKPATQLNLTAEKTNVAATLSISQLQEEAFRTSHDNSTFSAALECGGGELPDAVPIAVGCALGGLVVVVLIAYLEGRRRSAARGYLSM